MHSSVIGMQSVQQERRGTVITFSRGIVGDGGGSEVRRACFTLGGGVVGVAADARVVEVEVEEVVLKDEPDVWHLWTKHGVSGVGASTVRVGRGDLGDMKLA